MTTLLLTPAARPNRPFPTAVAIACAVAVLIGRGLEPLSRVAAAAIETVAVIAACGLAAWLEDRLFNWATRYGPGRRFALGAAVPVAVWIPAVLAMVALDAPKPLPFVGGVAETAQLAVFSAALWLSLAAVGSLLVLVLDLAVSAAVPDFKSRITLAIFILLLVVIGLAASAGALFPWLAQQAVSQKNLTIDSGDGHLTTAQVAEMANELAPFLTFLFAAGAILLALPALLSACGKLADAVMERLNPLGRAFELVSSGQLEVQVEEKGSREFVQLNKAFNQMARTLGEARGMERTFGAYLGAPIVQRIRAQHAAGDLPAASREATVLFADIRGFTTMSEKLAPQAVMNLLNRYLERAVGVVEEHEGYINKFIGDAIVVIFNGPIEQPDHAERGARCARALQQAVGAMNAQGAFPEVGELKVGIGVATGPLVAGNLGKARTEYTVIGDTVNLAARLTSHAGPGEAWVNEANARTTAVTVPSEALAPLKVKGKAIEVVPYRLLLS